MPHAGPLKQILRGLTLEELRAVRQEFCPRLSGYNEREGGKEEFVDALRRSLDRSMEKGEVNYEVLMRFIRKELDSDGRRVTTHIKDVLETVVFSSNLGSDAGSRVREDWMCGEIFQALRMKLVDKEYTVKVSQNFGGTEVDILIIHPERRSYAIEVKRLENLSNAEKALSQVRRYKRNVPNLRQTYVALVAESERRLPQNNDKVNHLIQDIEEEDSVGCRIIGPDRLR